MKGYPGANEACMTCVSSRAGQWGGYKEAEFGGTHRKGLFHTQSLSAMEEASQKKMSLTTARRNKAEVAQG